MKITSSQINALSDKIQETASGLKQKQFDNNLIACKSDKEYLKLQRLNAQCKKIASDMVEVRKGLTKKYKGIRLYDSTASVETAHVSGRDIKNELLIRSIASDEIADVAQFISKMAEKFAK